MAAQAIFLRMWFVTGDGVALQEKAKALGKRKAAETINAESYIASSSNQPHFKKKSKT